MGAQGGATSPIRILPIQALGRRPIGSPDARAAWPSGLGRGLQSPVRRFDSARRLHDRGAVRATGASRTTRGHASVAAATGTDASARRVAANGARARWGSRPARRAGYITALSVAALE